MRVVAKERVFTKDILRYGTEKETVYDEIMPNGTHLVIFYIVYKGVQYQITERDGKVEERRGENGVRRYY